MCLASIIRTCHTPNSLKAKGSGLRASHVVFKDLDRYLDRRLDGKQVLEIKLQEPSSGCDQIIVIRYEE